MFEHRIDLVVIIDCWERSCFNIPDTCERAGIFYQHMIDKLAQLNFDHVALATYKNEHYKLDPYIAKNLRSKNNVNLNCQSVTTMGDVYKQFPHLIASPNVLVCGLDWQACVHWRELGIMSWLGQRCNPLVHPDLVWHSTVVSLTADDILNDPYVEYVVENEINGLIRAKQHKIEIPDIARIHVGL